MRLKIDLGVYQCSVGHRWTGGMVLPLVRSFLLLICDQVSKRQGVTAGEKVVYPRTRIKSQCKVGQIVCLFTFNSQKKRCEAYRGVIRISRCLLTSKLKNPSQVFRFSSK